jgi:hypothetical protein
VDAELAAGTLDLFAEEAEQSAAAQQGAGMRPLFGGGVAGEDGGAAPANRLPPGWGSAVDPSTGNTYYFNDQGVTQWEPPV